MNWMMAVETMGCDLQWWGYITSVHYSTFFSLIACLTHLKSHLCIFSIHWLFFLMQIYLKNKATFLKFNSTGNFRWYKLNLGVMNMVPVDFNLKLFFMQVHLMIQKCISGEQLVSSSQSFCTSFCSCHYDILICVICLPQMCSYYQFYLAHISILIGTVSSLGTQRE